MPYANKENEQDTVQRLEAFWEGSSLGRPALNVLVKNPQFADAQWTQEPPAGLSLAQRELQPAYHKWKTEQDSRRTTYLGESMPGFHVAWGSFLTTLAVLAGGEYEYHDSAWIKEMPDILDRPVPRLDAAHPVLKLLDSSYFAACQGVGNRGFITPPLMMDGLSTMCMFRGAAQLCMDIVDRPDWVKTWSSALTTLYIEIYERYYRMLGCNRSLCFWGPMASGRSEGVQCDFAVNLSPAMYEEFVLPDLRRTTDYMDRSLYHLDGTCQMRFLDLLRRCPKLSGIQWNPETTAGRPPQWINAFREIRRRKFSLMIGCTAEEAVAVTKELGPDGLFLNLPQFDSVDQANDAIGKIEQAC